MRLSKRTQYAVAALVHLARLPGDRFVQARDLAAAEQLPSKYVELVLMALRRADLLTSRAGVGGGYRLARPASRIRVADVIEAIQGVDEPTKPRGSRDPRSPGRAAVDLLHERLADVAERALGDLTLEGLVEQLPRTTAATAMYYI